MPPESLFITEKQRQDPDVWKVFHYLSYGPQDFGEDVGFTCRVNPEKALRWLKENRPETFKRVREES